MGHVEVILTDPKIAEIQDWSKIKDGLGFLILEADGSRVMIIANNLGSFVKEIVRKYMSRIDPWGNPILEVRSDD